jgi:DNA uptake protein ComE-like DNA-binding protein
LVCVFVLFANQVSGRIPVNYATVEELENLPNMNENFANKLVEARNVALFTEEASIRTVLNGLREIDAVVPLLIY